MRKLRERLGPDRLVALATILTAVALTLFAFAQDLPVALSPACWPASRGSPT